MPRSIARGGHVRPRNQAPATETFTGTNGATWPSPWGNSSGTVDIQSNAGRLVTAASAYSTTRVSRSGPANGDVLLTVTFPVVGVEQYFNVQVRGSSASTFSTGYTFGTSLAGSVYLKAWTAGVEDGLTSSAFTFVAGTAYRIRIRFDNTNVQARIWAAASAEPDTWQADVRSTVTTAAGFVTITHQNGADGVARTATIDDVTVQPRYSVSSLGLSPSDPGLSGAALNLFNRLIQYQGRYALAAQQQDNNGNNRVQDTTVAAHNGGRLPAIRGWDSSSNTGVGIGGVVANNSSTALTQIISDWNTSKIIPSISQHWTPNINYDPNPGDTEVKVVISIANVLTPGNTLNTRYQAWQQNIGDDLSTLSTAGVPVLFRPFHEVSALVGHWWGMGTAAEYRQLWTETWNYLVNTRGLHNLIWVWTPGHIGLDPAFYPGDAYVDVIGHDRYDVTTGDYSSAYSDILRYTDAPKLRTMSEEGWITPNPVSPAFSWHLLWTFTYQTQNSDAALTSFYGHASTVDRSRVADYINGIL